MDLGGEEEETEVVPLVRRPRTQQRQIEASEAELELLPLAVLPPEPTSEPTEEPRREPTSTPTEVPKSVPEVVREVSPEIVEDETKKEQVVKGSGRKKTTAFGILNGQSLVDSTLKSTRVTRSAAKATESALEPAPTAAPKPPRQTQSKRAQTEAETGLVQTPAKKPRVSTPSSSKGKGKGKRITEFDTTEFLKINFSNDKGELDNIKLERFQGVVAKKEIKPAKVVKIEEFKDVFKHYDAVKNSGVFNLPELSVPFYPTLVRIFYTNAVHKVRSIDPLVKEHWIESSVMGKDIKLTNEVIDEILALPQGGVEWYQTDVEDKDNHDEDLRDRKGTGDMGFDDRVLFAIITNGLRPIRAGSSSINLEDKYFIRCIKSNMPVRWSSFTIHDMHRVISKETQYLHYGMLLTRIFEHFGIDVSVAVGQRADGKTEVGYASIKQYGYYLDAEGKWQKKEKKGQKTAQTEAQTKVQTEQRQEQTEVPTAETEVREERENKGKEKAEAESSQSPFICAADVFQFMKELNDRMFDYTCVIDKGMEDIKDRLGRLEEEMKGFKKIITKDHQPTPIISPPKSPSYSSYKTPPHDD